MRFLFSRQVEHFCTLYATRNLRQTAEQAGVTQPALSKSIQALERNLGRSYSSGLRREWSRLRRTTCSGNAS